MLPEPASAMFERQFGVAARAQLVPRHLTKGQLDGLLRRGSLVAVHRGVYRPRGSPLLPETEAMAAALRCRSPRAGLGLVTGPLALSLFGIDGYAPDRSFVVLVPHRRRIEGLRSVSIVRTHDVATGRTRLGPLPVTDPTRTLLELARESARRDPDPASRRHRHLRVAVHSASWRGRADERRLRDQAGRLGRAHEGARLLLDWLDRGWIRAGSSPEADLVELLRSFGLRVRQQVRVTATDRVDILIPEVFVIVEYDGDVDHDGQGARRDRARDMRLARLGYLVVRVRRAELKDPAALRRRLTELVRAHAATHGVVSPL